jgi:NAD(P)-dependent dehydrogenase (short-subunit alcohol dehydrogenase family)
MLKDASVIVTGGAKGIGRYIAHTFAHEGCRVAIADIDEERLRATLAELREIAPAALAIPTDVREESQVESLVGRVVREFGRLDVLVNNAGIVPHFGWGNPRWAPVKDMELDFWSRVIDTNLRGTFLGTKHALRQMVPQGSGHVLNMHGGGGGVGAAPYVVSKDAIVDFSRLAAGEVRDAGVFVATVYPGAAIATEDAPEEARQRMPGPELVGNRFVLAAEASLDLSGKLITLKDGQLVAEDWPLPPTMR